MQIRPYGPRIATEEISIQVQVFCNFKNLCFFVCVFMVAAGVTIEDQCYLDGSWCSRVR